MHIILTGGPGGGKSSLLEELRRRGFLCVDEVARGIIKEEVALGGEALPWKNAELFRNRMFEEQLKVYQTNPSQDERWIFFDRGLIDCIAYSRLEGLAIPEEMIRLSKDSPFLSTVFVTPPWEEIYCQDEERKQSFEEAIETYNHIVSSYHDYGYETIDLPKTPIENRVKFILDKLVELEQIDPDQGSL